MKVAIDTHPLHTTRAGVARYLRGLLAGLEETSPDIEREAIVWPYDNFHYKQPRRAWRTFYRELIWARRAGPRALARSGADVWFSPALPLFAPGDRPHVTTLHDLAVLCHPERFRAWQRHRANARLRIATEADRIICVSRFTAGEAMRLLGLPAGRLEVVHNGLSPLPDDGVPPGVPADFCLFVGSIEPGKNLALLREVWARAEAEGAPLPALCIAGARWPGVAREGPAPLGWVWLGEVTDGHLGGLYRRARALVFPSRYEGFGLPVLEAMGLGCPVLAAPVASLPEVGGDAVAWAELDPKIWLTTLRRLLTDEAWRSDLRARGVARAAPFTWTRAAQETAAVWRSLAR